MAKGVNEEGKESHDVGKDVPTYSVTRSSDSDGGVSFCCSIKLAYLVDLEM